MQALHIERTDDTPKVVFDMQAPEFEISGKSLPEDVWVFYEPLFDWLEEYTKSPLDKTVVKLNIEYFNSASHKAINDLLEIFADIPKKGKSVLIKWHFLREDEDMLESGHDFADLTGLNFEYIGYEING